MKKILAITLALTLCFGITACAKEPTPTETPPPETVAQAPAPPPTEETTPITYTYKAEPMQNAQCGYSDAKGKVMVWSQCPNCGEENIGVHAIDPAELDFSFGDTIMHSGTDSCWDCSWDKNIDQFMWTIRITRIPE